MTVDAARGSGQTATTFDVVPPETPSVAVSVGELTDAVARFLRALGMPSQHARWTAEALVDADRGGVPTHGTVRLESYAEALRRGDVAVDPTLKIESDLGSVLRLDAGNAQGQVAGRWAVDAGMRVARSTGVCVVAMRRANHLGMLGFYVERAARAGFAGWLTQATSPTTLAVGAREPRLGNNPVAFAVPTGGDYPLVLDISCSAVSRGRIRLALREGAPIPEGWALRPDGEPARTAAEAMAGGLLPFGGHKGAGLATVLGAFSGVLTGAAFGAGVTESSSSAAGRDIGVFAVLIDTAALLDGSELRRRMGEYVDYILASPTVPGAEPVSVPGRSAWLRRCRSTTEIELPEPRFRELERLLRSNGVEPPTPIDRRQPN